MNSAAPSRAAVATALAVVTTSLVLGAASPASAATAKSKALTTAAAQKGDAYEYGATGPDRFDCSGLTQYAYKKAGKSIPRVAQAQYSASKQISWRSRQKGDLVAIGSNKRDIEHVGLYAGYWSGASWYWHAPKPGQKVQLSKIKYSIYSGVSAYYGQFNGQAR
ncbi:cell wall-associated NlpC family hydrolase [Streptomyces sp. V3I8]|uniref:C40 family peptidase n=1 Tax=Streptomyces sp. V3I8 TaxID=3042279 RepID=UPI002780C535|nr:NlpC/P60 family protein [Streptomyces sp. V3I8]MDQ1041550.1 cell wall-associated NlpC family hydrolase [Streptomyces sp. V3I8]